MTIKTLTKAKRIQQARFRAGKPGFSRAVRRFIVLHPEHYDLLNKIKNERRGSSQGKDKAAGGSKQHHAPSGQVAASGIFQRAVNFQQEVRRG